MAETQARTIETTDQGSVALTIEEATPERTVGQVVLDGRAFNIIATRDEGLDGEPASWRGDVAEKARHDTTSHLLGWEETNVGYASADEALEETARRLIEAIGAEPPSA